MADIKKIQALLLKELITNTGTVEELALALNHDATEVRKALRGLREDGLVSMASGVYSAIADAVTLWSRKTKGKESKPQVEPGSPLDVEFQLLEERLKKRDIADLELKTQVLEKLEPMLSGDIGQVLLAIRDDLKGVARI